MHHGWKWFRHPGAMHRCTLLLQILHRSERCKNKKRQHKPRAQRPSTKVGGFGDHCQGTKHKTAAGRRRETDRTRAKVEKNAHMHKHLHTDEGGERGASHEERAFAGARSYTSNTLSEVLVVDMVDMDP